MPGTLWRVGAEYANCWIFAILAIGVQFPQLDCNLHNHWRLIVEIALRMWKNIQSLGDVSKLSVHGLHQAVRFTLV